MPCSLVDDEETGAVQTAGFIVPGLPEEGLDGLTKMRFHLPPRCDGAAVDDEETGTLQAAGSVVPGVLPVICENIWGVSQRSDSMFITHVYNTCV